MNDTDTTSRTATMASGLRVVPGLPPIESAKARLNRILSEPSSVSGLERLQRLSEALAAVYLTPEEPSGGRPLLTLVQAGDDA
ncbi:MAG TPA: hypothetical protein VNI55_14495 [Gaiellaceae bacterium]|nr:hypothetical protein [Gaiellaceae bacterium]